MPQPNSTGSSTDSLMIVDLAPTDVANDQIELPVGTAVRPTVPLNFRASPAFDAAVIDVLEPGRELTVLVRPHTADGDVWVQVRDEVTGVTGWVVADFVEAIAPGATPVPASTGPTATISS